MSKHTPGPWQYAFEGGTTAYITEADGTTVCKLSTTENSTAHSRLADNARLIAAAPDMLATLQTILNISLMDNSHWAKTIEREAHAAILKVTGAQS